MTTSGDLLRHGERRYVTVLFADMKGFTEVSRRLDPEEMDLLMDSVFGRFEKIISAYGGSVEKYIGDALVAVFGVPQIHEDDPSRAVYAALDFLEELPALELGNRGGSEPIGFRIGINTGLITTGKRGQQEVVTGHAMAVAARLESEAGLNTVFVSETTRQKCSDDFLFSKRRLLTVSGVDEPVAAYQVLRRLGSPPVSELPFFGRETLLAELNRRYLGRPAGGVPGVTLTGPPGIGKTRLATVFVDGLRRYPRFDAPVLYARARRFRRSTFSVIHDLIVSGLGLERESDTGAVEERVEEIPALSREEGRRFAGLLRRESEERLDESELFLLLYRLLEELCRGGSKEYPPILFVDNLHYIDRQSEDFLAFFFQNTESHPFILATSRTDAFGELPVFGETEPLEVPPLEREEAGKLMEFQLRESNRYIDEDRREEMLRVTGGNPLFVVEYARYAENAPEVPTTIQSIFLTAVDAYTEEQKSFLKKMSAFVHSFDPEEGRFLLERTNADPTRFEELTRFFLGEGVIYEEAGAYFFRNDAFKLAIYSTVLNHNKRILHRAIADYMRRENAPEYLRLMHHLSRAEAYEELEALLFTVPGTITHLETIRYVELLLDHLQAAGESVESSRVANLLFYKAAIYFNNGKTDEADREVKSILAAAVEGRNYEYAARAYHILTAYNVKLCSFQNAELCGRKALAYYGRCDGPGEARRDVLRNMAVSEMLRNRPEAARRLVEEIREFPGKNEGVYREALGETLLLAGEYRPALDALSVELLEEDPEFRLSSRFLRVRLQAERCDYAGVLRESAGYLAQSSGNAAELSQVYAYRAVALAATGGESSDSRGSLRQAEFAAFRVASDLDRLDALRSVTEAHLLLGNYDQAERYGREGITIGLRHSGYYPTFSLLVMAAELSVRTKRTEAARFFLEEASFYIDLKPRLRGRDVAVYRFLRWCLGVDGEDALEAARDLIALEAEAIGDEELVDRFLRGRLFAMIEDADQPNRGCEDSVAKPRARE